MLTNIRDLQAFREALYSHLSPSGPITRSELLKGRDRKLQQIERAFYAPGRHIFIYGDRGVGKTSLAQTAAFNHQSSEALPIMLACGRDNGFYRLIQDLVKKTLIGRGNFEKSSQKETWQLGIPKIIALEIQKSFETGQPPTITSLNDAVMYMEYIAKAHSRSPVIIIDEFDRIESQEEREMFADFIKQLGDQQIGVKLIFTGIGKSLDHLLVAHHSCFRYLETIELERLDWESRFEIIRAAGDALGVKAGEETEIRISAISDGFPHYIHLICEKLFWEVYNDDQVVSVASSQNYVQAIKQAVVGIEAFLRQAYDLATQKYSTSREYEEILWAVVDNPLLKRRSTDIYNSYLRIMANREFEPLSREKFNTRMGRLKTKAHGEILMGTRAGWYELRENIMRGYIRLRAEEQGVQLDVDHLLQKRRFA